jgi:hypothetical protein
MRWRLLFLLLTVNLFAEAARAEALAPTGSAGSCLAASVDALQNTAGSQVLYRIVFHNRCDAPRSFSWCAEHPAAAVPATVACTRFPGARGFGGGLQHLIQQRKEFQWHLPAGARIRFHDCPNGEVPSGDAGCEAPAPSVRR